MSLSDWPGDTRFLRCFDAFLSTYPQRKKSAQCRWDGGLREFFAALKSASLTAGISLARAFAAHLSRDFLTAFSTRVENVGKVRIATLE